MVLSGLVTGWAIAFPIGAVGAFLVTLSSRTTFRVSAVVISLLALHTMLA